MFYSYAHLPSCLDALPTPTPTTSPQPSSPWQYTEMYSTGMTHQSVEYWVLLDYLVHTKMAIKFKRPLCMGIMKIRKRQFFCNCLCSVLLMLMPFMVYGATTNMAMWSSALSLDWRQFSLSFYWCCRCSSLSHITCVSLFLLFDLTLLGKGRCYCGALALGLGPRSTVFCLLWALAQLIIQRMY